MVFGDDLPITITDDPSIDSHMVEAVAARRDCYYNRPDVPLGHFAGDIQTFIDALELADQKGADIAIKMSQRCMVAHKDLRAIIEAKFRNPLTAIVMPGRPNPNFIRVGHQQFARFPILTDMVFMRREHVSSRTIKDEYEAQLAKGKEYHDCFVEVFFDRLRNNQYRDRVELCEEITNHRGGQPPYYIRRYQNLPEHYTQMAERFGIHRTGTWELEERHKLQRGYNPRPQF